MLTLRQGQLALMGLAMLERFIDEEAARLALAHPELAGPGGREQVHQAVLAARAQGQHSVTAVRAHLDARWPPATVASG